MSSNSSEARRRSHRREIRNSSSSEEIETIDLNIIPSTTTSTKVSIPSIEQV
jgi:hypothetical protein